MKKIPKNIKKNVAPLGGIGAERTTARTHALVLDDRLLSKQYITSRVNAKVDDTAFSSSWSTDSTTAPSKAALHAKFNALSVNTSAWTQEDTDLSTSKTKTYDSGNVGIGSTLAYSAIDEKLVVDGNIKSTGDLLIGDDVSLLSDASILNFGADSDVNLTHVHNTGLLLNSTRQLQFNDASQYISGASATKMDIRATDEIELTSTLVDVVGALTVSGTTTLNGALVLGDAAADTLTVNATLQGASPLTFEGGTADGYETTFAITDPTADRTITFPNKSMTVAGLDDATALAIALG